MKTRKVALVGVAALTLAVIAAACGGDGSHGDSPVNVDPTAVSTIAVAEQTTAPEDTPSPVDTEVAQAPTQEPTSGEPSDPVVEPDDGAEEIAVADVPSAADDLAALEWTSEDVDLGIKPAISLLPDGTPMIAYMTEDAMGFVRAAVRTAEGFEITTVAEGYYYGPLDLAIGNDGAAHIAWHDHQALGFDPDKGDATYALFRDGSWSVEAAEDLGHDGWDNRITTDADGRAHMSGIDPRGFSGNGLEYYSKNDSGQWSVERVPSGTLEYTFATSIAIDPNGEPHISYYDDDDKNFMIASRDASGWSVSPIDTDGDAGYFSELVIDDSGRFHISYMEKTSDSTGTVKYATRGSGETAWTISTVGELAKLTFGFSGARHSTSIALDSLGRPWVAFGDRNHIYVAVPDGDGWASVLAFDSGFQTLGQLVTLALDVEDKPHIAYFQATNLQPLQGRVKYLSGS
jgi:hypothetical protein